MELSRNKINRMALAGISLSGILALFLLIGLTQQMMAKTAVSPQTQPSSSQTTTISGFGYGFNVAQWETDRLQNIGFNWMKVFDAPSSKQPVNVLLRMDANASHLSDVNGFANTIESIAINHGDYIDAYEIGNEVNLDATYGWGYGSTNVPPNAEDYVTLLCAVYSKIKAADPTAVVVSAGLAPTGRVAGDWNGHPGHNGLFQDEREYFKEFVIAGGGACLDAVGYHPYGYSADYDTAPDTQWGSPDASTPKLNCTNGFCFRGAESFYQVMVDKGLGDKKMWATEFGWITEPPAECLSKAEWIARQWQIVDEQTQADNLVGAFTYATTNYPWMEAMFIFNLNFNTAPWITDQCEQMRYYGIVGRPAESALTNMEKVVEVPIGKLTVSSLQWTEVITVGQPPISETAVIQLSNSGTANLTYTVSISPTAALTLTLNSPATAVLMPNETHTVSLQVEAPIYPIGHYSETVKIMASGVGLESLSNVKFDLYIFEQLNESFLPLLQKE